METHQQFKNLFVLGHPSVTGPVRDAKDEEGVEGSQGDAVGVSS